MSKEDELKAFQIIKKHFSFYHIGTNITDNTFNVIAFSNLLVPCDDYYFLKEVLNDEKNY